MFTCIEFNFLLIPQELQLGSLESTQKATVSGGALLRLFRALQTSHVLHISTCARLRLNQLSIINTW